MCEDYCGVKIMTKITISLLIIIISFIGISAQQTQQKAKISEEIEVAKPINPDEYKDWQKIETKYFSLYMPKELKQKEGKCIDSAFCDKFISENLFLGVDINVDANYATFERSYPSYSERYFWIDGAFAWIWSYENEGENKGTYKYSSGAIYRFKENSNYRIGMHLHSKNTITKEIGEKIFRSIKFNYKPTAKN
jgi:hypothetical protein